MKEVDIRCLMGKLRSAELHINAVSDQNTKLALTSVIEILESLINEHKRETENK